MKESVWNVSCFSWTTCSTMNMWASYNERLSFPYKVSSKYFVLFGFATNQRAKVLPTGVCESFSTGQDYAWGWK